mgnify:CR=1 FL=1
MILELVRRVWPVEQVEGKAWRGERDFSRHGMVELWCQVFMLFVGTSGKKGKDMEIFLDYVPGCEKEEFTWWKTGMGWNFDASELSLENKEW